MKVTGELLRAELLKLRTTRLPWVLLGSMALLVVALVVLSVASGDRKDLAGEDGLRNVLPLGGEIAYLFALALGIIGMAGEYRHDTIGHTLLAAPARWQVIVAKVVAYALAGLALGAVAISLTYAIAGPWMASKGYGWSLSDALPKEIVAGSLAGSALFGVIGVGLAALITEQVLALFAAIGWTLLIDSILTGVVPEVGKFLPSGAFSGLTGSGGAELLDPGAGALVLVGYAAAFVAAGAFAFRRRDLT